MAGKALTVVLTICVAMGCTDLGRVVQGRTIAFDKAAKTVTMILDVKAELGKPVYDHLPPVTFQLPDNPEEMGPEPKAGGLIAVDPANKQLVRFDPATQGFQRVDYVPIEEKTDVGSKDPLVAGKKFPVIDRDRQAVTIYDKGKKLLLTFSIPESLASAPDSTFVFGDEVRIYYKVDGKAQRFMNVTQTDIFKK